VTQAEIAEFVREKQRHMEETAALKAKMAELERTLGENKKLNDVLSSRIKALDENPDATIAKMIMEKGISMEGIAKQVVNDPQTILMQEIKNLRAELAEVKKTNDERISQTAQSSDAYRYEQKLAQILTGEKYKPISQGADIMETIHSIRPNPEIWTRMAFDSMKQQQRNIPPEELADIILSDANGVIERFGKKFAPKIETAAAPKLGPDGKPLPDTATAPTTATAAAQPGAPAGGTPPATATPTAPITNATETALNSQRDVSKMTTSQIIAQFAAEQKAKATPVTVEQFFTNFAAKEAKAAEIAKQNAEIIKNAPVKQGVL
jgi:hypothetical protein